MDWTGNAPENTTATSASAPENTSDAATTTQAEAIVQSTIAASAVQPVAPAASFDLSEFGDITIPETSSNIGSGIDTTDIPGLSLDFNVDSLDLDKLAALNGFNFDAAMANILGQVNSASGIEASSAESTIAASEVVGAISAPPSATTITVTTAPPTASIQPQAQQSLVGNTQETPAADNIQLTPSLSNIIPVEPVTTATTSAAAALSPTIPVSGIGLDTSEIGGSNILGQLSTEVTQPSVSELAESQGSATAIVKPVPGASSSLSPLIPSSLSSSSSSTTTTTTVLKTTTTAAPQHAKSPKIISPSLSSEVVSPNQINNASATSSSKPSPVTATARPALQRPTTTSTQDKVRPPLQARLPVLSSPSPSSSSPTTQPQRPLLTTRSPLAPLSAPATRPLTAGTAQFRPQRPVRPPATQGVPRPTSSTVPTARPAGSVSSPSSVRPHQVASARPGVPMQMGARPTRPITATRPMRPGSLQSTAATPSGQITSPTSAQRPLGPRPSPGPRPRPTVRPQHGGPLSAAAVQVRPGSVAARPVQRPMARPVFRPVNPQSTVSAAVRPLQPGGDAQRPPISGAVQMGGARPHAPQRPHISGVVSPGVAAVTKPSSANDSTATPASVSGGAVSKAPGSGTLVTKPVAGAEKTPTSSDNSNGIAPASAELSDPGGLTETSKTDTPIKPTVIDTKTNKSPQKNTDSSETTTVNDAHKYLTESVEVHCPALVSPPAGLEIIYGLPGAFQSLCHGVLPTNSEWSSLNIVAVTWPQLEVTAETRQRVAQRDVSDVSNMTAADSMRTYEQRRPPSSQIHLYRLHVHPPPVWDTSARLHPMGPSLVPLCELRMQQQWDEQLSRANMDRLLDPFQSSSGGAVWPCNTVNVSGLSGWHSGMNAAGLSERMRVASPPRCAWSADCRMLAAGDRAGRFEIFQVSTELNSWGSVYHVDFECPVVACLWLNNHRKYGISRKNKDETSTDVISSLSTHQVSNISIDKDDSESDTCGRWSVDSDLYIKRLPFFGPRNTQGEYALIVLTADGQLILVYQRDEKWVRVVSPLQPTRRAAVWTSKTGESAKDTKNDLSDPWSNIPEGQITHADMMLVSRKWIYLSAHRAGAQPVQYPHEPNSIPDALKHNGRLCAPTVEVYRIQVEFVSDYSPRLFATPLVVQPIMLPLSMAKGNADGNDAPRVTHIKLITALNPEVRPVSKNILGEKHYFPLVFVSMSKYTPDETNVSTNHNSFTTYIQVWRLEGAAHAHKSVSDLLNQPPPLKLSHMWTEQRRGLLLSVIANRAERQQLRYLFAKPNDKDYRALMLTWADGRVEMLRNYQDHRELDTAGSRSDCFDQCVAPVRSRTEWVIGSVLSPHYTTYFQIILRPKVVELGKRNHARDEKDPIALKPDNAVSCEWSHGTARFRLGWTPFFSDSPWVKPVTDGNAQDLPMNTNVHAYCGDMLAMRILNKEDPSDLVAVLANIATFEENQPIPSNNKRKRSNSADTSSKKTSAGNAPDTTHDESDDELLEDELIWMPKSRTLEQALRRSCELMSNALGINALDLDPQSSTTPYVRRLLGAMMQIHYLAQHDIQATSLGLVLHIASVVDARITLVHEHVIQNVGSAHNSLGMIFEAFSAHWQRSFQPTIALAFWCIDLFVAMTRDTYLYLNARSAVNNGRLRRHSEIDASVAAFSECEAQKPTRDQCVLAGGVPSRVALLFHRPTLEAIRSMVGFVRQLRTDLLWRVQILSNLPPNASSIPVYSGILQSKDMVVSAARQLAHALEYLPINMDDMTAFLSEVQDLYAGDKLCNTLDAQTCLLTSSTVCGPFRKHVSGLSQAFMQLVVDEKQDVEAAARAQPSALVFHDTRWIDVVVCKSNMPGMRDGTAIFETPWRVQLPISVTDPGLLEADADALVPAAELVSWDKERCEFERALDEDNVLFDIDDPGFIFFDTTRHTNVAHESTESFAHVAAIAAASAPVKITAHVPDFSDIPIGQNGGLELRALSDAEMDKMFAMPLFFDNKASGHLTWTDDDTSCPPTRSTTPCTARNDNTLEWSVGESASRRGHSVQHFAPHYSDAWSRTGDELSSGWQFVSTPRDPKLHIPTLLAQHAYSLAVLAARSDNETDGGSGRDDDDGAVYCIDWSRSDGIVVEGEVASSLAASAIGAGADCTRRTFSGCVRGDQIDVVRKTMLAADAKVKMCLRCGHVTQRAECAGFDGEARRDVGWIRRFDVLCVCGGSWIAI